MSESLDENVRARCGCVRFDFARGRSRKAKMNQWAVGGEGSEATDAQNGGGGAGGGRGRGNGKARGGRGSAASGACSPTGGGAAAGVGGATSSLRDIKLDVAEQGGDGDRGYSALYSPRAPPNTPAATTAASSGSGTPRYKMGGGGLPAGGVAGAAAGGSFGSSAASAVPSEWRPAYERVRLAVVAEAVRATVEWSLKRRWEVPCAPELAVELQAAIERRVPDADAAHRPEAASSARDAARWVAAVRSLKESVPASAKLASLAAECEQLLLAAMAEVVEPNLKALADHLGGIAAEQLRQAAEALRGEPPPPGAATDAAVHAKATAVHHVLAVALDDVQQQFAGGMADVCAAALQEHVQTQGAQQEGAALAAALIGVAVEVRRRAIEAPWRLSALVAQLQQQLLPAQAQPGAGVGAGMQGVGGVLARGASSLLSAVMGGSAGSEGAGAGPAEEGRGPASAASLYRPPSLLEHRRGGVHARLSQLLAEDPHAWLRELLLQLDDPAELLPPSPPGIGAFVLSFIAGYLDPHIDGERQPLTPAQLRSLAKEGSLPERMKQAWETGGAGALATASAAAAAAREGPGGARGGSTGSAAASATPPPRTLSARLSSGRLGAGGPPALPEVAVPPFSVPTELLVGAFVRHAVHKMNMQLGFGAHVPGVGRQPISQMQQARHAKILAVSVLEAVQRDFNGGNPVQLSGLALSAELLEGLVVEHLQAVFAAHADLNAALAIANKEGEEARKVERMRIWGYA